VYRAAHLSELPVVPTDLVQGTWTPVRHHLGITAFGTNAYTGRAGELVIEEHDDADEELYVVVAGEAEFVLDGERLDAPVGTLVFVTHGTTRAARAKVDGTTVLVVGATPGKAFEVSKWERSRLE
jgi:mannose-6-phosphate isomerase-like protein (cupin superfamily)